MSKKINVKESDLAAFFGVSKKTIWNYKTSSIPENRLRYDAFKEFYIKNALIGSSEVEKLAHKIGECMSLIKELQDCKKS